METKEIIKPSVENPITLNYAVIGTSIRLIDKPELLLIDYQEDPAIEVQKKLPAGRFQVNDLNDAIEWFLQSFGYNFNLAFVQGEVYNLSQRYTPTLASAKNHSMHNRFFNEFTDKLLNLLQTCKLTEQEFEILLKRTQMNTFLHEMREETGADVSNLNDENVFLSSSQMIIKGHYKIGYVSAEVDAPNEYKGSPDPKVLKSYWSEIDDNTLNSLSETHKSKFQEGIAKLTRGNLHPKSYLLKKFDSAAA